MLTRLEVDGFKNLLDFTVEFGPFTCIAGANAVGKSNVLDAIQLLSLLADFPLVEAALKVRGADPETSSIQDLFWTDGVRRRERIRLAAEMLVVPKVVDDFGRPAEATSTFLRYEVKIRYEAPSPRSGLLGRLLLEEEHLSYITQGEAANRIRFPHTAQTFRKQAVRNKRRTSSGYISTHRTSDGKSEIVIHQDGGSRGPGQTIPADTAPRTVLGAANTSETPTVLAARREMQRWRVLSLEPSAMRSPDRFQSSSTVSTNGAHLPATLHRLGRFASERGGEAEDIYAEIASSLSEMVPVTEVTVRVDDVRQLLTLEVTEASGVRLPASSLSDGTLRFLALSIIAADPEERGIICLEEPENGIHPASMPAMADLLREIAVDTSGEPGEENPLRQVIVASHSPPFVVLQEGGDLLFAIEKARLEGDAVAKVLACQPLVGTWRAENGRSSVGRTTILDYLSAPAGTTFHLPGMEEVPRQPRRFTSS